MAEIPASIQKRNPKLGWFYAIEALTIIGIIISTPFVLFLGLGLAAAVPLVLFLLAHRRWIKRLKTGIPPTSALRNAYDVFAILAGAGSAFGFFMLWGLSHGVDTVEEPFAPYIVMCVIGCPLITLLILINAHKSLKQFT